MERYRRAAVFSLLIFCFFTFIVLLSELPLIPEPERPLYACVKLIFVIACLPLAYFINKNPTSQFLNALVAINWMSYSIQGQIYRPLYIFSFCQVTVMLSFIFPLSKALFRWILSIALLIFMSVLFYHWQQFVEASQHPEKSDIMLVIFAFSIIAWVSNSFFTSDRLYREETVLKFAKIGTQTSRIVHDLKGLTSSPLLYLQVLESKLPPSISKEVGEAMELLSRDLEGFRRTLFELNQLTASRAEEKILFPFSDVLSSLQVILKKQLGGVIFDVSGDLALETDKNLLTSIALNILMNSIDAFKQRNIRDGKIRVRIDENKISFSDNAGGFHKSVLKAISQGRVLSTRPDGSGLGLVFVFDGMKRIGGKAKVFNLEDGACVELQFPDAVLKSGVD
jgi:signal transduction histidine kinase